MATSVWLLHIFRIRMYQEDASLATPISLTPVPLPALRSAAFAVAAAPAVRVALVPRAVEGAARSPVIFPRVASISSVFPFVVSCFLIFALSLSVYLSPSPLFLSLECDTNQKRKKKKSPEKHSQIF